jgi:hypothetical protein
MSQDDTDKCFTPFDGDRAISNSVLLWRCEEPNVLRGGRDAYTITREGPDTFRLDHDGESVACGSLVEALMLADLMAIGAVVTWHLADSPAEHPADPDADGAPSGGRA